MTTWSLAHSIRALVQKVAGASSRSFVVMLRAPDHLVEKGKENRLYALAPDGVV